MAAWLALEERREQEALALARSAADREDAGDKPPVTPGSVLPARELLGEVLIELERPAEALTEFKRMLRASPNRFRSLYGAARAARLAGDDGQAETYYERLLELARDGVQRPAIKEAKRFVER